MTHLFLVYRKHQYECARRLIIQEGITDYKIYFFNNEDIESEENLQFFPRHSLTLRKFRFIRLLFALIGPRYNNIYIGDGFYYRLYTLAFFLVKRKGILHVLDDGNTSLLIDHNLNTPHTRMNRAARALKLLKKVEVKYSGFFIEDLKHILQPIDPEKEDAIDEVLIFGTSIATIGSMAWVDYLELMIEVVKKCKNQFNCETVRYYPHPIEETEGYDLAEMEIIESREGLNGLQNCAFLTFTSSMSIELALQHPKSQHWIIRLSDKKLYSEKIRDEYSTIENLYLKNGIRAFF